VKTIKLAAHLKLVEARRAQLAAAGLLPPNEALRNRGLNRTEEKRELLRRVEARAKAAGVPTMKAYYYGPHPLLRDGQPARQWKCDTCHKFYLTSCYI
jgi:hypothetical protein